MDNEWKGRKESLDFCFSEMTVSPKKSFGMSRKFLLLFCFGKTLEKSYKTSAVNSHILVTWIHRLLTFGIFALWFSVFAECISKVGKQIFSFIYNLNILDYIFWSIPKMQVYSVKVRGISSDAEHHRCMQGIDSKCCINSLSALLTRKPHIKHIT